MKYSKLNFSHVSAFIILVALLSSCNQKDKPKSEGTPITITGNAVYSDTATSSVRVFDQNGKVCIQQSNIFFEIVNVYEGKNKIPLLLKIKKTELCVADSVNRERVYEIEAKSVLDTKSIAWTSSFVATEIEFKDNVLLATKEGSESEEDLLTRYSLLDGKAVISCSYNDMKIVIPNVREKRFIGFISQKATTNPIQNLKEENVLGLINYSSCNSTLGSVAVKLKRSKAAEKIPTYTPEMTLVADNSNATVIEDGRSVILMKANENYTTKDITDFSVKFTFYYGDDNEATDIIIPIRNDKLDIAGAKLDKDIFEIILH